MLCDNCKKNEATVHIKEFHNGVCETHHLCAECAGQKEQQGELGSLGFKLSELLFNALPQELLKEKKDNKKETVITCPVCRWNTKKFRESSGKVGCPECYKTFAPILKELLSTVQRGQLHLGKRPACNTGADNAAALKLELKKLQNELTELIAKEEYENAAVCRDKILALRKQLEQE